MSRDRSKREPRTERGACRQPRSVADSVGDPLREVRVLKRRVQAFVYLAIALSQPFYHFVVGFTLLEMVPGLIIGLFIAVTAIEGAFYQMFRLRKRSAYPRLIHQELGMVSSESAAGERALQVVAHLTNVERGCITLWRPSGEERHFTHGINIEECRAFVDAVRPQLAEMRGSGEPVWTELAGGERAVLVPVMALGRTTGFMALQQGGGADLGDTQLLKDMAISIGVSLENWRQREELRQSENRLWTVVSNVPVVVYSVDSEGVFTLCEGRGLEELGLDSDDVVGRPIEDVYSDYPEVIEHFGRALKGDRVAALVRVGGLWWDSNLAPVLDDVGNVTGVIGVSANVTARKEAEDRLRLTQASVDHAQEAILWIGPDARILNVNDAACQTLGYDRDELLSLTVPDIDPAITHEMWPALWQDMRENGSVRVETVQRRKDGTMLPVEISANFLEFDGKEFDIAFARDITERKRAEEALRESEAKYRELVESISDIIYAEDENGVVTYVSPAVERVTGYAPDEVIGRSADEFIHPDDLELMDEDFVGQPREFRIVTKSGEVRWLRSSLQAIEEDGERRGLRGVLVDITERVAAEEALRESEEKYRDLVENSNEVIYSLDEKAVITYISPAVETIGGYRPEEITGRSAMEFIHPDDLEDVVDSFKRILTGEFNPSEYRLRTKSGEYRWVRSASRPVYEGEKIVGVRGLLVDITERKVAEEALRESEERFRALVEHSSDGIALGLPDGTITYAGPSTQRILGYEPEELSSLNGFELVHPDDVPLLAEAAREVAGKPGTAAPASYRVRHKDGSWRWIEVVMTNLLDEPSVQAIVTNYRDVTERKLADEALRRSEETHRALALAIPDMMMRVRRDGTITDYKPDDRHVITLPKNGQTKTLRDVLPGQAPQFLRFVDIALSTRETQVFEYQQVVDGRVLELEARIVASSGDEAVVIVRDITERKNSERIIRQLAYHDALTGLPNRALFEDRLKMALAQAKRSRQMLAVMFLDLDRFKVVNETLGHSAGDRLLCMVADELSDLLREGDTVARVGGDEFTLLLPGISSTGDAIEIAGRILNRLKRPKSISGREFRVTTSIGITVFPADGEDPEMLLRNADTAMYRAKDRGRDNYQLYTPQMNESAIEKLSLESDLRRALEREEFEVYYQPIADVKTGYFVGAEALVRWNHPDRGLIQPDDFIPFAEETGLIIPLGEWVLRESVNQARVWMEEGLPPLRLTVNLSARQLQDEPLIEMVSEIVKESGLPAERLQLEITEGAMMHNVDSAIRIVKEIRHLGIGVAVDDFGTGYSSLSYLKRFPVDTVKIDRSFVRDLTIDPNDAAIVTTVLAMARNLGLHVVAEGVETRHQLEFLRKHGCNEFQGYLLSRPIRGGEFIKLVKAAEMARPRKNGRRAGARR